MHLGYKQPKSQAVLIIINFKFVDWNCGTYTDPLEVPEARALL